MIAECCNFLLKLCGILLKDKQEDKPQSNHHYSQANTEQTVVELTPPASNNQSNQSVLYPITNVISPTQPVKPGKVSSHVDDINLETEADQFRAEAKKLAKERGELFEQSQVAWNSGDKSGAKKLSDLAKSKGSKMEEANRKASELYFKSKNAGRGIAELDLHGQFVKEAIAITDKRIGECKSNGVNELVIIVGKGLHSQNGVAKIKPAIQELIVKQEISATMNEPNPGCLTVHLHGEKPRGIHNDNIIDQCPIQ
ncbi:hypothetical protein HDV02_004016 [Globomyces sp. JEL0801]|nr:hypothetical protein HDV02_004016 [Globomyces sp. JEL0801]